MELYKIFQEEITYKKINNNGSIFSRKYTNGIDLIDAFYYRCKYSEKHVTKEYVTANINTANGTLFKRQSFESKENNIPLSIYENIFHKIHDHYNCKYINDNDIKLIAIDGTYNNDIQMNERLNMGFYNVSEGIPIDLVSYGKENKNREIHSTTDYIMKNYELFKNHIIVGDRGYFSYDFMKFLIDNKLQFIIRTKGEAKNLNQTTFLRPCTKQYNVIKSIQNSVRIIKYENIMEKIIYASNSKKTMNVHNLRIKNDCIIVTNILDDTTYSDKKILDLYKSRWSIEVFFKYIKGKFKFQHLTEKNEIKNAKMYICELILSYIAKIVEKYYTGKFGIKKSTDEFTYKINKSHLMNGIFSELLYKILKNTLSNPELDAFCEKYIIVLKNKTNRSFPRTSKTPFTKWYIKGYSNHTKFMAIIDAIKGNSVCKLNKNLRTIAKKIVSIDGVVYS